MPTRSNIAILRPGFCLLAIFAFLLLPIPSRSQEGGLRLKTVVIDAGHGGHDPGAVSKLSKMSEKEINLDLALLLGARIQKEYPDVKVIYTRKTDKFVELAERGNIANRNHADLFISIHVNSAKSTAASGTETFVMGTDKSESNMAVCKRENSVILLEEDYSTTYEGFEPDNPESYIIFNLMQNAHFEQSIAFASLVQQQFISQGPIKKSRGVRQAPLMVLWRTTMPSVLVEVGFLSNSSDRTILNQKESRQKIKKPDAQKSRQTKHQHYQKEERKVRHGKNKCSFHGREHFHLKTGNYRIECKIEKKYNAAGNNQKNTVKNRVISPSGLQHKAPVKEHKTDKNNLD